ncbi:ribosome maturation factor RimP [Nocardia vermiculata]|uniref:Ribosome maturation factor RimP n=1 Tax=Nocardia vermiculata TaxID=257274 RepID=A0A846Y9Y8_9NOCA|nr:ribosome maturation factor RimP [Nocardia vermiculata]NKY53569.1 ribosome maturation factor RimP [Nocardia vermiculata]
MPMPTEERVSQLVAELVERRGLDLEGVRITGGPQTQVTVTVDGEETVDLDAVAELSSRISEVLDEAGDFGDKPYLLEVTTPGVERPLTELRHWRRSRGRKVRVRMRRDAPTPDGKATFDARVGAVTETEVALVLGGKRAPHRVTVPLADIDSAVVQVEFSPPGAAELELAGGVAAGRPEPGAVDQAVDVAGSADVNQGKHRPVVAPTEGTVE